MQTNYESPLEHSSMTREEFERWLALQSRIHRQNQSGISQGQGLAKQAGIIFSRLAQRREDQMEQDQMNSKHPAPISHADLIAESDRAYDLGRKHVKEELAPQLAALQRLYKSCAGLRLRCEMHAPQIKGFSDWEENTKAMQAAENVLH